MNISSLAAISPSSVPSAPVRLTQAPVASDPTQTTLPPVSAGAESVGADRSSAEQGRLQREQGQSQNLQAQQEQQEQETQQAEQTEKAEAQQQLADQQEISRLAARDAEVRAHEQAHAAVGGQYAGAPSYSYKRGPDGQSYAVSGEVSIDASPIPNDPEATLAKMQQVLSAALAPAEPSSADLRIAAQAQAALSEARAQLAEQQRAEQVAQQEERAVQAQQAEEEAEQAPEETPPLGSPFELELYRQLQALSAPEEGGFSAQA
ncbi:putative metalloprotease CJM1_0395 family protein [Atopomonas sediminilitoris]|uniref:putative metalloprotease CJM1_0395 family protein n=1 Tax=Atopomonas sediminilitoris TaxID=2919919 RepID=UPI001F4D3E23|nr:putative metalloprotease CJM1_0395 family protein [Atopomonas sediminilitoris]MCJ8170341.1 hypothetical protein [Atopomonas sediminilitoris]